MRVFVLGAGASAQAGYPLTRDLGSRLIEWAKDNRPPNCLYWVERDELGRAGPLNDIEELVTRLEAASDRGPDLAGLREALCRFFDSIRPSEAELYREFAGEVIRAGDVIISFNYDLSLELELKHAGKWEASDGYGFDVGIPALPKSPVKLLKLHGSTNWMDLLFEGLRSGQFSCGGTESLGARPVFPWGLDHLGYSGIKDPQYRQGGVDRSGSMILPGRKKRFYVMTSVNPRERERFWTSLWTQAADALRHAGEITMIGYSLPAADAEARGLLLESCNPDALLSICCGRRSRNLGDEFVSAGFRRERVRTSPERFEELLEAQKLLGVSLEGSVG